MTETSTLPKTASVAARSVEYRSLPVESNALFSAKALMIAGPRRVRTGVSFNISCSVFISSSCGIGGLGLAGTRGIISEALDIDQDFDLGTELIETSSEVFVAAIDRIDIT